MISADVPVAPASVHCVARRLVHSYHRWYDPAGSAREAMDAVVECQFCSKLCRVAPGQSGECRIRVNIAGSLRGGARYLGTRATVRQCARSHRRRSRSSSRARRDAAPAGHWVPLRLRPPPCAPLRRPRQRAWSGVRQEGRAWTRKCRVLGPWTSRVDRAASEIPGTTRNAPRSRVGSPAAAPRRQGALLAPTCGGDGGLSPGTSCGLWEKRPAGGKEGRIIDRFSACVLVASTDPTVSSL